MWGSIQHKTALLSGPRRARRSLSQAPHPTNEHLEIPGSRCISLHCAHSSAVGVADFPNTQHMPIELKSSNAIGGLIPRRSHPEISSRWSVWKSCTHNTHSSPRHLALGTCPTVHPDTHVPLPTLPAPLRSRHGEGFRHFSGRLPGWDAWCIVSPYLPRQYWIITNWPPKRRVHGRLFSNGFWREGATARESSKIVHTSFLWETCSAGYIYWSIDNCWESFMHFEVCPALWSYYGCDIHTGYDLGAVYLVEGYMGTPYQIFRSCLNSFEAFV